MIQLVAFCRSLRRVSPHLVALAVCSAAIAGSVSPASARSHHRYYGHYGRHVSRHVVHRYAFTHHHAFRRHYANRRYRHLARISRWDAGVAHMQTRGLANSNASLASDTYSSGVATSGGLGSSNLVAEARRYIGGNPTSRGNLWCARFMNMVLQHEGYRGTGSDMARSFASYGQRVSGPQIGAIAVMSRRGGGHVGIISGIDAQGNPIMISGNNGNRVREAPVSRGRIYAYVMPTN
jgi:uncharacterized protein (TIGR02594 family)